GSTAPRWEYLANTPCKEPAAYGRGSTGVAPSCSAAMVPAPKPISPWVSVGPSSTTMTDLPRMASGSSTVTGEAASMTTALGLARVTVSRTAATCSGGEVSTLLMMTASAERKFVSPGWYDVSWPARCGSATVMCKSGT